MKMKLPKNLNKRYFGFVDYSVKPKTKVQIWQFWDCTEVNLLTGSPTRVACFKSYKHAIEFCKLNNLVIVKN